MFTAITVTVTAVICFAGGVYIGRKSEQKIVANVLSEFALVDQEARGLVNRCYSRFASGVRTELDKILKR